jgi:LCP family protein required for cell wall assembly
MQNITKKKFSPFVKLLLALIGLCLACFLVPLVVYGIRQNEPIAAKMDLPFEMITLVQTEELGGSLLDEESNLAKLAPICGDDAEWILLAVGIDYRGDDYLYGLADVIRMVRVDFTKPQVNVVPIPRNMLVNPPERLNVDGQMLLNQAYFFGTPGMNHYSGSGFGAGSLAETIYYNFGLRSDQYVVVDFKAFVKFIDLIGGIEVDLPTYVDNRPDSFFPAGKQVLNGEQAIDLARIRKKYSDITRINNQSIVLRGVFERVRNPAVLAKIPQIYDVMIDSVLTDLSPKQINTLLCLLNQMDESDLVFYEPPVELLTTDYVYIPNMRKGMSIFQWDREYINWLHQSIWKRK